MDLSASEQEAVRAKIDRTLATDGQVAWAAAWDQEVQAGADRTRLARIAVGALQAQDSDAEEMFKALVRKWGALEPAQRGAVSVQVEAAIAKGDWERALELEIVTADDAPAYSRAWALYERAPARQGADLLAEIQAAREAHAKERD